MTQQQNQSNDAEGQSDSTGLVMRDDSKFPRARTFFSRAITGPKIVNGRCHGSIREPRYNVEITFNTEEEAEDFYNSLYEGNVCHDGDKNTGKLFWEFP